MSCHVMYVWIYFSLSLSLSLHIYICIYPYRHTGVALTNYMYTLIYQSINIFLRNIHSFMNGFVPWKFHNSMGFPMLVCCQVSPLTHRRRLSGKHFVFHWFQSSLFQGDIFLFRFQWGFQYVHFKSNLEHIILEHEVFDFHHSPFILGLYLDPASGLCGCDWQLKDLNFKSNLPPVESL